MAVIALASLAVVAPFLKLGIPSGHDFEFHMNSWLEVLDHWKQGVIDPHWAAMAHYGYGEARFIFYPPLSWTLGAALGAGLPWKLVPAAYIWLVLALAGVAMFMLAREWLSARDATFAAAFYLANPYHLVIVYWRSAFAELLAAVYLPLMLLLVFRAREAGGERVLVPLSLLIATTWLTNLPSAVMMTYSLAFLTLVAAVSSRSPKPAAYILLAVVLGAGLAAVYLLPAYHEQSWVNISQVLAPGVRPLDNFLFTPTENVDHNRFNRMISIVALGEIIALAAILALAWRSRAPRLRWFFLVWGAVCVLLMLPPTHLAWNYLPELRYVQLPWRWMLCLNVPLALALPMALGRWWPRAVVCSALLALVLVVAPRVQVPWWDRASDVQELIDNQRDGAGNEGTDEYVPIAADPYDVDLRAPLARYEGKGAARIRIDEWREEKRVLEADTTAAGELVLRLFNYPGWRVEVNGHPVGTRASQGTAQMIIPLMAGVNRIEIRFVMGWDRTAGVLVSLLALAATGAGFLLAKRSLPAPKPVSP